MNKAELIAAVAEKSGMSKKDTEAVVSATLDTITDALKTSEKVQLVGFGSFELKKRAARIGRNPKTGDEVPIHPRRVMTFRPSHLMKDRVAAGNKG